MTEPPEHDGAPQAGKRRGARVENTKSAANPSPLEESALACLARGWSIILVAGKVAVAQWGKYQERRATPEELREALRAGRATGIAVVLGRVSSDLACRDFDQAGAYEAWAAAHPNLARTLPTARTARGYHVYFRASGVSTRKYADGELRGEGAYVLLPPSAHPSGDAYRWIVPPSDEIPFVEPESAGFGECHRDTRSVSGASLRPTPAHPDVPVVPNDPIVPALPIVPIVPMAFDDLPLSVRACVVTGPGQHDESTLRLARVLKFEVGVTTIEEAHPYFTLWWQHSRRHCAEEDGDEALFKFQRAFALARFPVGAGGFVGAAWALSRSRPLPPVAERFENPKVRALVGLLAAMHELAGSPFALSSHGVARVLEVDPKQANRWLRGLAGVGVIECVHRGSPGQPGRGAARWRWLGKTA